MVERNAEASVGAVANTSSTSNNPLERNGGLLVLLTAAAGTALTAAFFYPGYLNGDSTWQYRQALSGEYADLHPVIMAWVWSYLDRVIEGSGSLFLFNTTLFWIGLAMVARTFASRTSIFLVATFLIGIFPPVFSMLSQTHKDVGMVMGLVLGYGLLMWGDRSRRLWPLLLALVPLWYSVAVRHNGASAVVPLAAWMLFLLGRDHISLRLGRHLTSPLVALVLGTLVGIAMLGTATLASRAILGEKGVHYPYQQFLAVHDLLGISIRSGHIYIPRGIYFEEPLTMGEIRRIYDPQTVFYAFWGPRAPRLLPIETERPSVVDALMRAWASAIRTEPRNYLKTRAALFRAQLGIGKTAPFRKLEFTVWREVGGREVYIWDYKGPNVFKMPHNRWLIDFYTAAGGLTLGESGILFRPWPYFLLSLASVLVAWRTRSAHLFHIALLGASSIAYVLPHMLIGFSAELRYMWWPILASLIQPTMLFDGIVRKRSSR